VGFAGQWVHDDDATVACLTACMAPSRDLGLASVARLAGVSTATVSNTLNRPDMVSPQTRSKVMQAIEELDFVPNRAAATLRQGRNRLLGLVIPDVVNPFYAAIVDAVVETADRNRYVVALGVSHDDPARELRHFDLLAEQRAAGTLVVPLTADATRLAPLRMAGVHLILVDRAADENECCSVAIDDVMGGRLAVEHLLECTGDGMAIVNGAASITQCADRRMGARAGLERSGRDPDSLVEFEVAEMTIDAGIEVGRRIGAETAVRRIFCTNDQLAVGVIRGLEAEGIQTPESASVVGYGDLMLAPGGPSLTTIGQPKQQMGETAVAKLLAELEEREAHRHSATTFEPELIIRGSTAPAFA
jgi:LacI family transcriptional regulator